MSTRRLLSIAVLTFGLATMGTYAHAESEPTPERKTKKDKGDKPAEKAETPKEAVTKVASAAVTMILAGDFRGFMDKHCHPETCGSPVQRKSWERYQLAKAKRLGAKCVKDGAIKVTRWADDPAAKDKVKIFVDCGGERMPPPISFEKYKGAWKITQISI